MKKGDKHTQETKDKMSESTSKWKDEFKDMVFELCLLGLGNEEIAKVIGVSESTFKVWAADENKLLTPVIEGKTIADAKVAKSMYNRALGYEYTETKESVNKKGETESTETVKHIAGDTGAQMNWLANRQRKLWRKNDSKVEVNINKAELTDEEIAKRLKELKKQRDSD